MKDISSYKPQQGPNSLLLQVLCCLHLTQRSQQRLFSLVANRASSLPMKINARGMMMQCNAMHILQHSSKKGTPRTGVADAGRQFRHERRQLARQRRQLARQLSR
jgi:hypothetical protein